MSAVKKGLVTFAAAVPEEGLRAALERPRSEVIAEISASMLRGRGGAGCPWPAGNGWKL